MKRTHILLHPQTLEVGGGTTVAVKEAPAGLISGVREVPSSSTSTVPTGREHAPKSPVTIPDFKKMPDLNVSDDFNDESTVIDSDKVNGNTPVKETKVATTQPKETPTTKQEEKPQVEVEKQAEEKVVEQEEKLLEAIKPAKKKVEGDGKPAQTQRDYSGFSTEQQAVLKQMSNPAFEFTSKLIKENKELSGLKDAHYLQSPEGYTLTPEYKQYSMDSFRAGTEAKLWEQQLIAIRDGKEWTPVVGWNTKSGEPIYGNKMQPTTQAEEEVRRAMNQCHQVQQQTEGKMQMLPQQYQQRRQQDLQAINAEKQKMFAWLGNPEMMKEKVPIGGGIEHTIEDIRKNTINLFPAYERNTPGVEACGDMMVALKIYAARIQELTSKTQVAEIKQAELQMGEPSSNVKPATTESTKVIGKVSKFDMEGME